MKKAFTLIELLVVIAIIAILAAILFPVFAQAKEAAKKTQALSNTKQMGTASAIYMADYDDNFPLSYSIRAAGTVRWNTIVPFPADAITSGGWDTVIPEVQVHWSTSMLPYIKNKEMYSSNLQLTQTVAGDTYKGTEGISGMAMNGLLSTYSGTAIENPSLVPAFWTGIGSWQYKGRAFSNPSLRCDATTNSPSCRFNPGGAAQTGSSVAAGGNNSAFFTFGTAWRTWTYGKDEKGGGVLISRSDTSAKTTRVGTVLSPAFHTSAVTDPYAYVVANSGSFAYWTTSQGDCSNPGADTGTYQYICYFRPDRTR
ncbi:MAG: prepilin-type N-terminal cleavage/methylation domain-containing protein [Armatimonadetes bacterium]|nr:prepilin-type N-terminal cleavage/methylation domain-containing protein [Armatimonadota bacterium]